MSGFFRVWKIVLGAVLSLALLSTISLPASAATTLSQKHQIKVKIVNVRLKDTTAAQQKKINTTTFRNIVNKDVDTYWSWVTASRTDIKVSSVSSFTSRSAHSKQTWNQMRTSVLKDMKYQHKPDEVLLLVFPFQYLKGDAGEKISGGAWPFFFGGGVMSMPLQSATTKNDLVHEFGHILRLDHASSLECRSGAKDPAYDTSRMVFLDKTCFSHQYGDMLDVMGYSQASTPMISASFWDMGGFGDGKEIRKLTNPARGKTYTYRLTPWTLKGGNRAVKLVDPKTRESYYFELRAPYGYDAKKAVGKNRGVKITKLLGSGSAAGSLTIRPNTKVYAPGDRAATWQSGSTFTTRGGTKVKISKVSNTSATVTVVTPR